MNAPLTRVVRASLGAMSTTADVDSFVTFLHQAFIENNDHHHHHHQNQRHQHTVSGSTDDDSIEASKTGFTPSHRQSASLDRISLSSFPMPARTRPNTATTMTKVL